MGFCVAPTFWHTQKQWKEFLRYCPHEIITDINRGEHKISLIGRREIWFRSCDNPDSLRSEGIDVLWMDEGGQIKEDAWTLALRPALMDKKGIAFFTGIRTLTSGSARSRPEETPGLTAREAFS